MKTIRTISFNDLIDAASISVKGVRLDAKVDVVVKQECHGLDFETFVDYYDCGDISLEHDVLGLVKVDQDWFANNFKTLIEEFHAKCEAYAIKKATDAHPDRWTVLEVETGPDRMEEAV